MTSTALYSVGNKRATIYLFAIFVMIVVSFLVIMLSESCVTLTNIHFYLYAVVILLDFLKDDNSVSLIQVFLLGVIYIILSEGLLYGSSLVLSAMKFLLYSADFLLLGYFLTKPNTRWRKKEEFKTIPTGYATVFLFLLYGLYLYHVLPRALSSFSGGRQTSSGAGSMTGVFNTIIASSGLSLPAMFAYHFKNQKRGKLRSLLFSLPIFVVIFMKGTRFPLLFSMVGYLLVSEIFVLERMKWKTIFFMIIGVIAINEGANMMKDFRVFGYDSQENSMANVRSTVDLRKVLLSQKIAKHMSPEGVVDMMDLNMNYFNDHPHTMGLSLTFPLYFWVPRTLWKTKPTMIGYWLVREDRSVNEGHSASFSFVGEAYADFGEFSLIVMLLFGVLIRKINDFKTKVFRNEKTSYKSILASMMYPYAFFIVRSPVTASNTLIGVLVFYLMYSKLSITEKAVEITQIEENG